jgi:hypothetical protein
MTAKSEANEQKVLAEADAMARTWLNVRGISLTAENIRKVAAHPKIREFAEHHVTGGATVDELIQTILNRDGASRR